MSRMNQPASSSSQMTQSDDPLSRLTESACAVDGERFADAVVAADTRLRRLLGRLTGQSADLDDLLQETYLNAWKGIATFRRESSMTTWLTRIAVNVARNWLRRRRPQGSLTLDVPATSEELPEAAMLAAYHRALSRLSVDLRTTLVLHQSEGMSYQQIAETLSCPIGTVMSRLHRARAQVLDELKDRLEEVVP